MPKPSRAAQQPAAEQPNSLPLRASGSAQPTKASRYKLPFPPYLNKTFREVPVNYVWYLAGFDKYTAKGSFLRASVLALEYLKEIGAIQPKPQKKSKPVKFCVGCKKNYAKRSRKYCGKCDREREAARRAERAKEMALEIDQLRKASAPAWYSNRWLIPRIALLK